MADGNGNGNGAAHDGMLAPPSEFAIFRIGGQDIKVYALNLDVLDRASEDIRALGPELSVVEYAKRVLKIVSIALEPYRPELTIDVLSRHCSYPEARAVIGSMNELLRVSGFDLSPSPEASAESPGTGTSTPSSQNLESGESSAETPI